MSSSKSKAEKLKDIIMIVLAILIIFLLVYIILMIFFRDLMFTTNTSYKYECTSIDEQVQNTNKAVLNYYNKSIDGLYDSILVSPVCIQSSVYSYYESEGKQDSDLFSYFNNGYSSWVNSGELFSQPCFSTFNPGVVDNKDTLIGKASDISDGFVDVLGADLNFDTNTLYSIFHLEYGIKDAVYSRKDNMIHYKGEIGYKKTDTYESVKIPLSNDNYSVYLIDGDISSFDSSDFESKTAQVDVDSYTWQSYGKINGLAEKFDYIDTDVVMLAQFGFSENNHEVVNSFESGVVENYFFVAEYSVLVVDENTGLILAVGKHE